MNVRKILTFAAKGLTVIIIFFVLSAECGTLQRQKKKYSDTPLFKHQSIRHICDMCFMCLPYLRSRVHFHPLCLRLQNFFSQSEGLALKPWGGLSLCVKDSGVCLFYYSLFLLGKILQKLQKKSQIRNFMVVYSAGQFTGLYGAPLFIFHMIWIFHLLRHRC